MSDQPQKPDRPANRRPGRNSPKPEGNGNGPGNNPGGMRFGRGAFGWVLFIALAIMLFVLLQGRNHNHLAVDLDVFYTARAENQIKSYTIRNDEVLGQFTEPRQINNQTVEFFRTEFPTGASMDYAFVKDMIENRGTAKVKVENTNNTLMTIFLHLLPWLLVFGFIWFFVFRQLRNSAGAGGMLGNFGRSRHRITSKEHTNVTFDDVAGVDEAKDEVQEIVEFLKNPKRFQRLGGRIPRGVLLVGDPGTGKTLLAKAIAGEADVPFFSISGSDFVEMFVGVGASRVRDLFKQAKDNSPCIIFLDEIDAVGRRRGSGFSSGGHDEREQTLNAILVEMDGFDTNDQVIVVAATNRVDVLDPALTRPGRFDRQIFVPLPDVKGRMEILKVHSRKVKLGGNVDLARLARATPGFSGADLAAIINESALSATLGGKDFIEQEDLEEARDKVRWGRARKSRAIDEREKIATAYHEAGHAVVQYLTKDADPLHKVTIIPRGQSLGSTWSLPERDRYNYSRKWCIAMIKVCFGGRIAEEMFTNDTNSGVAGDIRQATAIARRMITEWGMSDRLGFVFYGDDDTRPNAMGGFGEGQQYSEETAKVIDEEVKQMIDRLYTETTELLQANRDRIEALAKALLKYESLDTADVDKIMRGDTIAKPTVSDLLEAEKRRGQPQISPSAGDNPDIQLGGGPLPQPG